ncbi:MAG: PBSX family phage terminase large subunit [Pseudomonadota bacterium]
MKQTVEFPSKLTFLLNEKHRYKILYGGRGGSKSWGAVRALIILATQSKTRILCAREIQNSIRDSVHKLISDQIHEMGFAAHFEIQRDTIKGINGSEFLFKGLRMNVQEIKSTEGIDICWVEEAQTVSKASWDVLIPTIRKDGSEIWITFNPELDTDVTYQRFVMNPPSTAKVVKINWQDNPWFPKELIAEKDDLKERDFDSYLTVWEGNCRQVLDGAIYAKEIRLATEDNRIKSVPYDSTKGVWAVFDLGRADKTSIWFVQQIGFEYRLIDFYENRGFSFNHYIKIVKEKPYIIEQLVLPHDSTAALLASERTIQQQAEDNGFNTTVVARTSIESGIEAARSIFNRCWFDENKCIDGINALRRYRYEIDESGQWSKKPLHDEYSHAADAFRYFAAAMTEQETKTKDTQMSASYYGDMGWAC